MAAIKSQWQSLQQQIIACERCLRLREYCQQIATDKRKAYLGWDYWGKPVPNFGIAPVGLLIVGLAPAAHGANRTGRMFTGDRSGDFLFRSLWRAGYANQPTAVSRDDGLELTDVFITAPVKCAPPQNKPTTVERDNCRPWIDAEVDLLRGLRVVVALGGFGFAEALRIFGDGSLRPRPRFGHGVEVGLPGGRTLVGCYHVSQQNTFTGRLTDEMLDAVFARTRELCAQEPTA